MERAHLAIMLAARRALVSRLVTACVLMEKFIRCAAILGAQRAHRFGIVELVIVAIT